jgi:hypothetical protein
MSSPRLSWLSLLAVLSLPLMTGGCGVPLVVAAASYGADGASLYATGKTSTDHLLSMASQQDCAMWRMMQNKAVCKEREGPDPYDVDYRTPERMQSEDGSYYQAPLRSSSEVPPMSWDGAPYKIEPAEQPKKDGLVTAAAPIEPTPQPIQVSEVPPPSTGAPAAAPTPKKKAHSAKPKKPATAAKKPSPGPAASRS